MSTPTPEQASNSSGNNQVKIEKHDRLVSSTTCYVVLGFNGEGRYGKVARCMTLLTGEEVAIKMHKDSDNDRVVKREVEILEKIRCLDPDKNHIVKFFKHFEFNKVSCLVFEMLDRSLFDLIEQRDWNPLSLSEIRSITNQLMKAFDALKSIGIIHSDLKPENVMLIDHYCEPFRIKLIDFGMSMTMSDTWIGMEVQPVSFRAPEVTLGLPLSEAIDVWGVGCIMTFLYFGGGIFPYECSYDLIKTTVHLLGQPEDQLLSAGVYTRIYFSQNDDPRGPRWRLKSPDEIQKETGNKPQLLSSSTLFEIENLEHLVYLEHQDEGNDTESEDRRAFLSLLKSTLNMDPERRITPRESLESHFLSMVHLKDKVHPGSDAEETQDSDLESDDILSPIVFSSQNVNIIADNSDGIKNTIKSVSLHFDEGVTENRPSPPGVRGEDPLQVDNEELRVAQIMNKFTNELQAEKDSNRLLQKELEELRLSYQLLNAKHENHVIQIKEQVDALRHDLDKIWPKEDNLQSATVALQEENKSLKKQLEKMTMSLHDLNLSYQTDVTDVRHQADNLRSDLKRELEQKKLLQAAYEELQEIHRLSQKKFSATLHAEKEKNRILEQDLNKIRSSHYVISQRDEREVIVVTQEADTVQQELGVESHADSVSEGWHALRAEQEAPHQKMVEEFAVLKEKEEFFGRDLDELQTQLGLQLSLNLKFSTELKAEKEQDTVSPVPACPEEMPCKQQETMSPAPACPEEMPCKQHSCILGETINPAPVLNSQEGAEGNIPAEPPSVWKRARHFLGLRKPKRWKKKKEDEN